MPFYECPECQSVVELPTLSPKTRGKCRCCGCRDITSRCLDTFATEEIDLSGIDTGPVKVKRQKPSIIGRMGAAPTISTWPLLPPLTLNADVTYVKDLTMIAWTGSAATCVRLPYQYLDNTNSDMQGLVIALPGLAADPVALLHFQQCTQQMLTTNKSTDVTEATGEAAAAMAMIKHYPTFRMQWGLHCHKGAGIDQIWTRCDALGTLLEVMIVEAKGPGACLSANPNMPPDFEQMGKNWIIHNLATMMSGAKGGVSATAIHQGTLAQSIVTGLGLTVGTTYPLYNGASKSYYGVVSATGAKTVKVRRLLVTARWQNDGLLSFDMVVMGELKAFVPTDKKFHADVHKRYPALVPSKAPEISYP